MKEFHLHLISDATGETLAQVARAAAAQFDIADAIQHSWSMIRTSEQIQEVMAEVDRNPGVVMFTLVDTELGEVLVHECAVRNVPAISVLDPVVSFIGEYLGAESTHRPGGQHEMDAEYFKRIEALNFTMSHDDGQGVSDLDGADIILVGVSRTSKTPTCIYLAHRGFKAANIPLVPGSDFGHDLSRYRQPMIVGLSANPDRLVQIRRNRLRSAGQDSASDYVKTESVRDEVNMARRVFADNDWPVIDVTRRSIEETAAEIISLYNRRFDG